MKYGGLYSNIVAGTVIQTDGHASLVINRSDGIHEQKVFEKCVNASWGDSTDSYWHGRITGSVRKAWARQLLQNFITAVGIKHIESTDITWTILTWSHPIVSSVSVRSDSTKKNISGLWRQNQVSQAEISNCTHRILWDAITYPCLRYLLLTPKSSCCEACYKPQKRFVPTHSECIPTATPEVNFRWRHPV